jgi:NAD(P)-dependent dehydrogenase (short-subunit alcohol dehydrogenase family)
VKALSVPVSSYDYASFTEAFKKIRSEWPDSSVRVGVFNAGAGYWKPFLDVKEEEIRDSLETNVTAAFGFSREAILAFKDQEDNDLGKKGTLIFTGATAALRGNKTTSAFAAGKFGLRALSQSLAKEFGPQGIHVSHVSTPFSWLSRGLMHINRPSSTVESPLIVLADGLARNLSPIALPRQVYLSCV